MFPLCPCPLGLDFKLKGWIHSSFPQNGSLFEADFILLDGIPANVIRGEKQYLAAPLVMLKMDPSGKLLPMVIQVRCPRHPLPTLLLFTSTSAPEDPAPCSQAPSSHSETCPHVTLLTAWFFLTCPTGRTCSRVIMAFWSSHPIPSGS